MNRAQGEVREFLGRWSRTSESRDIEGHADLYLRDPTPLVVFSDGSPMQDWLDVRLRIQRDLERVHVRHVEVHDLTVHDLGADIIAATFQYDMHVRDMWGTDGTARRIATMTLVRTKDGLRIASAHFSPRVE